MHTNLKPNKHKIISFNTTTMTSLGLIGPPLNLAPPKFFAQVHPNYFGLTFLAPPPPPPPLKLRGLLPWKL